MRISDFGRYAFGFCAALAMLAGCGVLPFDSAQGRLAQDDMQPPAAALGVMPQSALTATHRAQRGSWMLPEATREDLLYADASGANADSVYVFSYPKGKLVGIVTQSQMQYQQGLCSDAKGHVFVTTLSTSDDGGNVYEYAHGGTAPIETLHEALVWPWGCAVDPRTGNLAVASINLESLNSYVEVYRHAKGTPKLYSDNQIANYMFCGYDNASNLFVDGSGSGPQVYLGELPRGGSTLMQVSLSKTIDWYGQLQWDGSYITLEDQPDSAIYRLNVSGSSAMIVGTTLLKGWTDTTPAQSWIQNGTIVQPNGNASAEVRFWHYPAGGDPTKSIASPATFFGVTVSLARH
jgi:hypothetical protein